MSDLTAKKPEKQTENKTAGMHKAGRGSFRRGPNVIAVASGKGGVGKTWFSITLSHALACLLYTSDAADE